MNYYIYNAASVGEFQGSRELLSGSVKRYELP